MVKKSALPKQTVERRAHDKRVTQLVEQHHHLHGCVEGLKSQVTSLQSEMTRNTAVTQDVRDILGTFKVTMALGKWIAAVTTAAVGVAAAVKGWRT